MVDTATKGRAPAAADRHGDDSTDYDDSPPQSDAMWLVEQALYRSRTPVPSAPGSGAYPAVRPDPADPTDETA